MLIASGFHLHSILQKEVMNLQVLLHSWVVVVVVVVILHVVLEVLMALFQNECYLVVTHKK